MCLYEFYSMHALKWNLEQKQHFMFLQNSCVNFVLGIRLARWSSGSRFLETLRAAAPSAHSDLPPAPSPVSTLPTLVWTPSSLFGDENKRWTPLPGTECGMNRGVGDNVWMFQCSSNTPPTPLLISACYPTILFRNLPHPHPIQFSTAKTPNSTPVSGMQSPPPRIPQIPSKNFFLPPSPSPLPVWMKPECPPCPELQIKQISG